MFLTQMIICLLSIKTFACISSNNKNINANISNSNFNLIASKSKILNVSTILYKQVKLPCFVEKGRKFIWMNMYRDEIISVDYNIITSDKRFEIEAATTSTATTLINKESMSVFNENSKKQQTQPHGFWINLIINGVNNYDEGIYICQIDTMTTNKVFLNILGKSLG